MDKYECGICGYILDEAAGDADAGIKPGTKFADLPADWVSARPAELKKANS
jgi:rubredoxin